MKKLRAMPLFISALAIMLLGGALLLALPKATYSELENRMLAPWTGMQPFTDNFDEKVETFISDHFPGRAALVRMQSTLQAAMGQRLQSDTLLGRDGRLFEVPQQEISRIALSSLSTLQEAQETLQLPMTLMLLPTSAQLLPEQLPALYQPADQQALIQQLYDRADELDTLDAALHLAEDPGALYYRTDHHLTAEGAWHVYEQLAEAWGLTPEKPALRQIPDFLGSYYGRTPSLSVQPETFSVYLPPELQLSLDGEPQADLISPALARGRNKYTALLGRAETGALGDEALLGRSCGQATLTGGSGDQALLMISDSYGNAVAPLLAQHFARVDVIDSRYFTGSLEAVARESGATRVLALFGLNSFNVNNSMALLNISEED